MGPAQWEALEIPVGLGIPLPQLGPRADHCLLPRPRRRHRVRAVAGRVGHRSSRPTPGCTSSHPMSRHCSSGRPTVEGPAFDCHLVPIDACYELVGRLRLVWRGFDGGQDAHAELDAFFDAVPREPSRAESAQRGTSMSDLELHGPRHRRGAVRRGAAADREAADRGEHRQRDPRDRAAMPGADRAAATRLRGGRDARADRPVRHPRPLVDDAASRSCGCSAASWCRASAAPPTSTFRSRAPMTST